MDLEVQGYDNDDLERMLRSAELALDRGDVREGRACSQKVLHLAESMGHLQHEAKAQLFLAYCDRTLSRYHRAHRAIQRSAHCYHLLGDTHGEVVALTVLANLCINLGRGEEAVEAALLAVRLSCYLDQPQHAVLSYNALGAAYCWSRSFEKAEQALQMAIEIANGETPRLPDTPSRMHQWWTELVRLFHARWVSGTLPAPDRLRTVRESILTHMASDDKEDATEGTHVTKEAVLVFGLALEQCWHGRIGQALLDADALARWTTRIGSVTWLASLEAWVRAEIAWAQQDWEAAQQHVARMIAVAVDVEHEQLACLGHLLASQVHTARGDQTAALEALRALRQREQRIRAEALETREHVVGWQVDLRQRQQRVDRLEVVSRDLEKLTQEDTLTGIANRRAFERYAGELLRSGYEPHRAPCIALIDVDRFKQVNDGYSHQVGDAVLRTIAQILKSQVRDDDMAARLAGDEFVIVFKNAGLPIAEQACARIARAVREHDWSRIAAGLRSSISVGVAAAAPGDTVETLTHRSDAAMYRQKRLQRSG
jgi:diguanylate cyclase (GGDEF)-like protein